jgi:hypothetical protein
MYPWLAYIEYKPVEQTAVVDQFAFAVFGSATNVALVSQSA